MQGRQGEPVDVCCPTAAAVASKHTRLTSIPNGKASKLARASIIIRAALDQGGYEAMAVKGSVEVGRMAAHVAQQVAHPRPYRRLCVAEQLAQLWVGCSCGKGGVVVPVQSS